MAIIPDPGTCEVCGSVHDVDSVQQSMCDNSTVLLLVTC